MIRPTSIHLTDPRIIEVRASIAGEGEEHVNWLVDIAPTAEARLNLRVVFATLHAYGAGGNCDVVVGARMKYPKVATTPLEEFEAALAESEALETLYDYARVHARSLLGLVESDGTLPAKAPDPTFGRLAEAEEPPAPE